MPDETHKDSYSTDDMLEAAKRLRSPGFSPRTGKKLKRRSIQPSKERRQLLRVLLIVILLVAAAAAGVGYWWMSTHQQDERSRSGSGSGSGSSIPNSPVY